MAAEFPPNREADLVTWSGNFNTKIGVAGPDYGLTPAQTAEYGMLHDAFIAAYTVANDPATRSPMNIALKNDCKQALLANIRLLAGIIQSFPGTTNAKRIDLGLPVRGTEPTPIPVPAKAPQVLIQSVDGRAVRLRLVDVDNPIRRGKPAGVSGAAIFSYIGATPPGELAEWTFELNSGKTVVDLEFPATVAAGTTVYLTAFWFNPRKQAGPIADPVSTNLPGGSVSMAA